MKSGIVVVGTSTQGSVKHHRIVNDHCPIKRSLKGLGGSHDVTLANALPETVLKKSQRVEDFTVIICVYNRSFNFELIILKIQAFLSFIELFTDVYIYRANYCVVNMIMFNKHYGF